jgi:hypothetical protein
MGVRARWRRDASVVLEVATPGAGQLSASAQSLLVARARRAARAGRRGRGSLATRTVAATAARSGGEEIVALRLALPTRYRALAARSYGLAAVATVILRSSGHPPLRARIAVTFKLRVHRATRARRAGVTHVGGRGSDGR